MTVKDYCKKYKVTDAAVRKNKNLVTVKYNDLTYIVVEDNEVEKLKNKVKLQNSNIKALRNEVRIYTKQDEVIQEQKERILKLENRIEKLEDKLDKQVETKENLFRDVLGHMNKQLEHNN